MGAERRCSRGQRAGRRAAWIAVALALVLALPASASASCPDADLQPSAQDLDRVSGAIVCLLNVERAGAGLEALATDPRLHSSASYHTRDMISGHFLAHQGPRPHPPLLMRIVWTGYFADAVAGLYTENLGIGPLQTATARALVSAWMGSEAHRVNILRPEFRDIGVGAAIAPPDPVFYPDQEAAVYTTDFGRRYYREPVKCPPTRAPSGPSATAPSGFCGHHARRVHKRHRHAPRRRR
jgi:uncharacterized protein YkwD